MLSVPALLLLLATATAHPEHAEHHCWHAGSARGPSRVPRQGLSAPRIAGRRLTPVSTEPLRIVRDSRALDPGTTLTSNAERVFDAAVEALDGVFGVERLDPGVVVGSVPVVVNGGPTLVDEVFEDADTVIVLLVDDPAADSVLAFAGAEEADPETGRPLIGFVNFNPTSLEVADLDDEAQLAQWTLICKHELLHALGFSFAVQGNADDGFVPVEPSFWDPVAGAPRTESVFEVETIDYAGIVEPYDRYLFVTENVAARAQQHFGCLSLRGAPLEDIPLQGSVLVHWEKSIFFDELMSAVFTTPAPLSPLTLAFFEDSGWYSVDYSAAEPLAYGRNQGCAFLERRCNAHPSPFFCAAPASGDFDAGYVTCSLDQRTNAGCTFTDALPQTLPENNQYFQGHPTVGGLAAADYCPVPRDVSLADRLDCAGTVSGVGVREHWLGPASTTEGACAMSTLVEQDDSLLAEAQEALPVAEPVCLEAFCTGPDALKVRLLGESDNLAIWYDCPEGLSIFLVGRVGSLDCPRASVLCAGRPVDTDWPSLDRIEPEGIGFSVAGGDVITLHGANLLSSEGAEPVVRIDGRTARVVSFSAETIELVIPELSLAEDALVHVVVTHEDTEARETAQLFDAVPVLVRRVDLGGSLSSLGDFLSDNYIVVLVAFVLATIILHFTVRRLTRIARTKLYDRLEKKTIRQLSSSADGIERVRQEALMLETKIILPGETYPSLLNSKAWRIVRNLPLGDGDEGRAPSDCQYGLSLDEVAEMEAQEANDEMGLQLGQLFIGADVDGDGILGPEEFEHLMRHMSTYWRLDLDPEDLEQVRQAADSDGDGYITWTEFHGISSDLVQLARDKHVQRKTQKIRAEAHQDAGLFLLHGMLKEELEEHIANSFMAADANGDGVLSNDEFEAVLRESQLGLSDDQIAAMCEAGDANRDGSVTYDEFVPVCFDLLSKTVAQRLEALRSHSASYFNEHFTNADVRLHGSPTGLLPPHEVLSLLSSMELPFSELQLAEVVGAAPINADGMVEYSEWLDELNETVVHMSSSATDQTYLTARRRFLASDKADSGSLQEKLIEILVAHDAEGKGFLTVDEFAGAMRNVIALDEVPLDPATATNAAVALVTQSGGDEINYRDFVGAVTELLLHLMREARIQELVAGVAGAGL